MSALVVLLSCALIAGSWATPASPRTEELSVQDLANRLNDLVRDRHMTKISLIPIDFDLWGMSIRANLSIGGLDTFYIDFTDNQVLRRSTASDGSVSYEFDVTLGLSGFYVDFDGEYFSALTGRKEGAARINIYPDFIRLSGNMFGNETSECRADLQDVEVVPDPGYKVTIEPATPFDDIILAIVEKFHLPAGKVTVDKEHKQPLSQLACVLAVYNIPASI